MCTEVAQRNVNITNWKNSPDFSCISFHSLYAEETNCYYLSNLLTAMASASSNPPNTNNVLAQVGSWCGDNLATSECLADSEFNSGMMVDHICMAQAKRFGAASKAEDDKKKMKGLELRCNKTCQKCELRHEEPYSPFLRWLNGREEDYWTPERAKAQKERPSCGLRES